MWMAQWNKRRKDTLFYVSLFGAVLFFFLFVGAREPVLFDDSGAYLRIVWQEGVMPFYPLFLLLNESIFGELYYLRAVAVEQAFLASFSIVLYEETIRRRFSLHRAEGVILGILLLYPYTIEMPEALMTQTILTEGIAYSIFYLFWIVLLIAVWEKNYKWLIGAFGLTVLLTSIRSQLQILFGVCGIVFCYLVCMHGKSGQRGRIALRFSTGIVGCVVIGLIGVSLASTIVGSYKGMMKNENVIYRFAFQLRNPEEYQRLFIQNTTAQQENGQADAEEELLYEEMEEAELLDRNFPASQYMTLIFSRGMYEADREDAALFQDEIMRGLFLALYDAADAEQQRYVYAEKGLWMWKDIVGAVGKVGLTCMRVPSEYYVEYAPEIIRSEDFGEIRTNHMQTIGLTLIRAHFGRFLYHTLMLLPQAFISTIFFQYAPLYLLCHVITAFLYLSAAALMVWGYWDKRTKNDTAEMMALVLGTNLVMVIVISLVFFGQQRYLVYAFGPFYIAYYLLLRQLWCVRLREKLWKKKVKS